MRGSVNRKAVPGGKADLRQFVGDDRIVRQHLAQDVQIGHLRLDALDLPLRRRGGLADRGAPAAGLAGSRPCARPRATRWCRLWRRRRRRRRRRSGAFPTGSISIRIDFRPVRLERPAESGGRQFHAGADPDHQIGLSARACRRRPSSARVHARWRRCRVRCGTPPPAHRSFRRVREFPRSRRSRRCRRRSSASCWPRSAPRRP